MKAALTHALRVPVVIVAICALLACRSSQQNEVGVLTSADGLVERARGASYIAVRSGTKVYRGDRLRTGASGAVVTLVDGTRMKLEPQTEVVVLERAGSIGIDVGRGSIVLEGTGTYALEIGTLTLVDGSAVVSRRRDGETSVELVVGRGSLVEANGKRWELEVGRPVALTLELGTITLEASRDAGIIDTAPGPSREFLTQVVADIDGDGARVMTGGRWATVKRGAVPLAVGATLVLDTRTTAALRIRDSRIELAGGTRITVGEDLALTIERGAASANLGAADDVALRVPGGEVARAAKGGADVRLWVDGRGDSHVVVALGSAKLTGKQAGAIVDRRPGETAIVRAAGTIAAGDVVIPTHFDLQISAGTPAMQTLHDPAGVTAVRFDFGGACAQGGVVEMDDDPSFRLPRVSYGERGANLLVPRGRWSYRVRCAQDAVVLGPAVASGQLHVVRDNGRRPLPTAPPRYTIDADGRNYHLHYQSQIPDVEVRTPGRGSAFTLHLSSDAAEKVFTGANGGVRIPSNVLRERVYKFWFIRDGRASKVSTLKISFDQTAAQVYIESPIEGAAWTAELEIRGATLPGWTASVEGITIPSDPRSRRFRASVAPPADARAIGIRVEHPAHGVHVYVRRRDT